MRKLKPKAAAEDLFKRLRNEIIPLFEKVVSEGSAFFSNPHIVKCRESLECKSAECPLYDNRHRSEQVRCWQTAGTYCSGEPQGSFVQKYGTCSLCQVFKDSCPTIVEEMGEHFNNMVFLLKKQHRELRDEKQRTEDLNQELTGALEQLKAMKIELQKMQVTDGLTGLFNRHHLLSVLKDEIARCNRYGHFLALIILSVDDFKNMNDEYGYHAGDKVLTYAGHLIQKNIRKFDRAFRYSNREFIIVLPETDLTFAYIAAERIRKSFQNKTFSAHKKEDGSKYNISRTASIGITAVSSYRIKDISIDDLIDQAAKALHIARAKGGNVSIRYE